MAVSVPLRQSRIKRPKKGKPTFPPRVKCCSFCLLTKNSLPVPAKKCLPGPELSKAPGPVLLQQNSLGSHCVGGRDSQSESLCPKSPAQRSDQDLSVKIHSLA